MRGIRATGISTSHTVRGECISMDLVQQVLPAFLVGTRNTLLYCISAFPLAVLLGMFLSLLADSRITWFRVPARNFSEVMRGTPFLAQIYILHYGLGGLLSGYGPIRLDNPPSAGITAFPV